MAPGGHVGGGLWRWHTQLHHDRLARAGNEVPWSTWHSAWGLLWKLPRCHHEGLPKREWRGWDMWIVVHRYLNSIGTHAVVVDVVLLPGV